MEDPGTNLMNEFGSLLDETTILSISADYDLTNATQYAAARDVLRMLAQTAEAEEATGFNPSGLGADGIIDIANANPGIGSEASVADDSDAKNSGSLTPTTESSHPFSLTSGSSSKASARELPGVFHINTLDGLSDAEQERELSGMFTSLKIVDVRLALRKSEGDASQALDTLLNLQWLEESGHRPKGVDGFFAPENEPPGQRKKGKKKKKGPKTTKSPMSPMSPTSPISADETESMGQQHDDTISWLAERLYMPGPDIRNVYYRANASTAAAAREILDNYIKLELNSAIDRVDMWTRAQINKFSWVPPKYIESASAICPSEEYASDIINLLAEHFEKPAHMRYDISYNVVAADAEDTGGDWEHPKPRKTFNVRPGIGLKTQPIAGAAQVADLQSATTVTRTLAATKDHSYTSAAAAYRKGKSDPLFRQAAGFYAERAREQANNWRQATNAEANLLVDRQSTAGMIDLHGVTVLDGMEIALDRAWRWWDGMGEERARLAKQGLLIVTGIGRHSAGGKSRLSGSVCKALLEDGWKVEVRTGSYLVTGRRA